MVNTIVKERYYKNTKTLDKMDLELKKLFYKKYPLWKIIETWNIDSRTWKLLNKTFNLFY